MSSFLKGFTSNISSNYSVSPHPISTSGPWKIHDAKKKGTGKAVSVFIFDRKSLEPQGGGGGFGPRSSGSSLKRAHEEVVERLKKEASSLARLRHPSILELAEPVEETRSGGLMFATEPVTASLGGLLDEKTEQERMGGVGGRSSKFVVEDPDGGGRKRREIEVDELEIQKGLLQVGKGLEFLHESAGLVHANLTPEAIMVNAKSDWKISGLGFSSPPDNATGASPVTPISLAEVLSYDARLPRSVQLNVDYSSPDFVMDTNITQSADMFSLGLIVLSLYNSPHTSPIEASYSVSTYKRVFSSPSTIPTANNNFSISQTLPKDIKSEVLPRLITRRPAQRYTAREFQQARYFDNVLVSTLRFLESLPAKTPNEKTQFMRGLPRILSQFPKSVLEKKVLPALLDEMKDHDLLSLILQNVFKTVELVANGRRAFTEKILPALRRTFITQGGKGQANDRDAPKEGGLNVILDNMKVITENCSGGEFKDDILPILYLGLESPTHSLVDHALQVLPIVLPVLDFSTIKNEIFPVISSVFSKTTSMAIKIQGLKAINTLCGGSDKPPEDMGDGLDGVRALPVKPSSNSAVLDKYTVQEKIVPLLKAIKTKEPAVMMAALSVFQQVGRVADSDFLALHVLPTLWSFSLGPLLNLQQFRAFMSLIKSLSTRIENEQSRKLQELSANHSSAGGASRVAAGGWDAMDNGSAGGMNGMMNGGVNGAEDTDFESLVTGRKDASGTETDLFNAGWGGSTPSASSSRPTLGAGTAQQRPMSGLNNMPTNNSNAPRFSWSTTTNTAPTTGAGSITPDMNAMNSLSTLQPTPSTRTSTSTNPPFSQTPLQPQRANSSSTVPSWNAPALQPAFHQTNQQNSASRVGAGPGTPIDWSTAANRITGPASTTASVGNTSATAGMNKSFSNFGIAPPPSSGGAASNSGFGAAGRGVGAGGLGAVNVRKEVQGQGRGQTPAQTQGSTQATGQKQGMEKYESLI